MKIKRKLYPNSNDKEFILMSVNDLAKFAYDSHAALLVTYPENLKRIREAGVEEVETNPVKIVYDLINEKLNLTALKTPASHQKKTKKKSEENVNV